MASSGAGVGCDASEDWTHPGCPCGTCGAGRLLRGSGSSRAARFSPASVTSAVSRRARSGGAHGNTSSESAGRLAGDRQRRRHHAPVPDHRAKFVGLHTVIGIAGPPTNIVAVVVAATSSFLLGGLWYSSALFGPTWQREAGDLRKPGQGHPARVFGISFLFSLVAASFGINYQFDNRSGALLLIDGGYQTVQFLIYGLVLGLWRWGSESLRRGSFRP